MQGHRLKTLALCLILSGMAQALAACGGGGGGGGGPPVVFPPPLPPPLPPPPPPPPPPPGGGTPVWSPGVFEPAAQFANRCEFPRSGVDIEGNRFPDQPGTGLIERFWLRSWTNETYLWNMEVVDRDPNLTPNRRDYFALLRTFAKTASGKDKDDFHFSQPTEEFLRQRNSTPSATYGARIAALASSRPRDFRVQYTEPNSPAAELVGGQPRLRRGTRILSVDGVDLVNGGTTQAELDILNRGLFPAAAGQTTTFVVRDPGASADRTVTITSINLSAKPVNRTATIDTPTGKVGYVLFNTFSPFSSERDIVDAMESMRAQGVADLVLDLRYNGGGLLTVASQLAFMVAGEARTVGRTFERLRFNAAAGDRNPVTGQVNTPMGFRNTGAGFTVTTGTPLPALNLPRVYVLSTDRTCSASEAVINGLRGIGVSVTLIGGTTCGKPYGFYPTDNCGETWYTIQFQGVNDLGFGDYADGFVANNSPAAFGVRLPGCAVADDYSRELGDPAEAMLAAALGHRATGTCPAVSAGTASARPPERTDDTAPPLLAPPDPVMMNNRDMTPPGGWR